MAYTYNTFKEPSYGTDNGELHIVNNSGYVSWKTYAKQAGQHIKVARDSNYGVGIWLSEFHTPESGKMQERKTSIHLELEQLEELISHLQMIKSEITK